MTVVIHLGGVNGVHSSTVPLVHKLSKDHDLVLKTFRLLIADLCQQFNGGHPGGAIGMAAIGVALWRYVMRYAPHTPGFFNRDRFVLSNGHTCLFQYSFLHLTGYKAMTFEQLKSYHSDRVDALCPGHPEIEHEGIEVTTGPLGQGLANAVGMAMATKNLAATYNRPGFDVVSNHTWCMIGDACLQEGVALEAISLAGHFRLNNLTVIYDNNQITCDGSVDLTNTEDVNTKMRACGWDVIEVVDGCFDIEGIVCALEQARSSEQKPTFINIKTVIGLDSSVAGTAVAHGAAFGAQSIRDMKAAYGFNPEEHFVIGETVRQFFEGIPERGEQWVQEWNQLVNNYAVQHPALAAEFMARVRGELPANWDEHIPTTFPDTPTATRVASGLVFNPIAEHVNSFMVGTADLSPSVNMIWPGKVDFQHPELRTTCGINGTYSGRYIHYGVREHAMAAISNGLAAYSPNTIVPVTSTFFMFYLYAAPAVRMGALQHLQIIHVATHDSIGMGEDGPTHQPIELANLYRAMPNLLYIRPGDSEETAGAWIAAIGAKQTPSIISTSRQTLPQIPQTRRDGVALGAYVLSEAESATVTLIGAGAELSFVVEVAEQLKAQKGITARVISFPCQRLFEKQSLKYKRKTLRRHQGIPAVIIEPYAPNGWERYADAGICVTRFGHSLPGKAAYKFFGFDVDTLAAKVARYLERIQEDELLRGEFVDL
ncbi:Transketolase C-terminal/Pyruvate-ferredoxin oxidoreductase domain II [Penicillium cf. griseofulvum]|uniref:transketolase n=1 Tax=Penicillium cf. griseofulvum TaxID=2972120 RepID=A0A9W9MS75_9EURO|nr:Transketolase C-terminal/Pyruvate-ferredoxin oxidoreductase domain II [Penicillium cf. griseofulvum]KAJ5440445.1 Transketolase C-terminal/Pyruvate-ferredoxin oxidoreductase domain II [Penicillium cf. griseofulvum]KAJ5448492.1 Transketolase C-terminal/Pyruvate-ferredoxin oxidoreductase domain II [Penicillium cf. griseofulvum]